MQNCCSHQFCAKNGNDAFKVYEDRKNAPQLIKDLFAAFTFNPSTLFIQKECAEGKHEKTPGWAFGRTAATLRTS